MMLYLHQKYWEADTIMKSTHNGYQLETHAISYPGRQLIMENKTMKVYMEQEFLLP